MSKSLHTLQRLLVVALACVAADGKEPSPKGHWSFRELDAGRAPIVRDQGWPRTVIDKYILAKMEAAGLSPNGKANRNVYIRRLTYDLIGLPPTPQEVADFVSDPSPNAYEKLVDRLLSSPQYGERWGRHWLDVVRYADSNDLRAIGARHDITETYRYRDWVVRALNGDLPYNRFMMNQIAGDLLPGTGKGEINRDGIIATGMLAFGSWGPGDSDGQKMHSDMVDDMINVTTRAFLALTVGCARCHDHKFDPITQADYYALAGIFFSTEIAPPGTSAPWVQIPLVGDDVIQDYNHKENLRKQTIKKVEQQLTEIRDSAYQTQVTTYVPETSRYLDLAFRYLGLPAAEKKKIDAKLTAQLEKASSIVQVERTRQSRHDALKQWIEFLTKPTEQNQYTALDRIEMKAWGRDGMFRWHSGGSIPNVHVNASDKPFAIPSIVANTYYGRIVHAESALAGVEQYRANKVHLNTDDGAPTNGIVSLLFRAPQDGAYTFSIKLTSRINAKGKRDPFYHIVVNEKLKEQGRLQGFNDSRSILYKQLKMKRGDTLEVCATGGGETFPQAIMETDVVVTCGKHKWDAGREFHSPSPGSPIVSADNPLVGNVWEYGYRKMLGEICDDWSKMNPSPFRPLMLAAELGPDSDGKGTGHDLNSWTTPAVGLVGSRALAVQPGLKSGIGIEWTSPSDGRIRILGAVEDLQAIEDGVTWQLDYQPGNAPFKIASGIVRDGARQSLSHEHGDSNAFEIAVRRGDIVRLSIGPRSTAVADTTRIDWTIEQVEGKRSWNLVDDLIVASARGFFQRGDPWRLIDLDPAKLLKSKEIAEKKENSSTNGAGASENRLQLFAGFLRRHGVLESDSKADVKSIKLGISRLQVQLNQLVAAIAANPEQRQQIVLASRVGSLYIELVADNSPFRFSHRDDDALLPESVLARVQQLKVEQDKLSKKATPMYEVAMGAREGGPKATRYAGFNDARIHENGHYAHLGAVVARGFPKILAGSHTKGIPKNTSGRKQLAEWIGDPKNPLPARVLVNRIWLHHFGQGLVRTPGNFGLLGKAPTHHRLLDYLAKEFIASGWSIKKLHRQIVLSATYQQSTLAETGKLSRDPENRFVSRMLVRRLEAEAIRDTLLAVSGRLDQRMGGPVLRKREVDADAMSSRRALYLMTNRSDKSGFRFLFDAADPESVVDQRNVSTVAPQSLFMLNHPFVLDLLPDLATVASAGLTHHSSDEYLARKIRQLYQRLYARTATAREIELGIAMIRRRVRGGNSEAERNALFANAWQQYCHVLLCTNELIYLN